MLQASNKHFDARSRIKIPKIWSFFNLKSAKIAKKCGKKVQLQFWKVWHVQNILEITPNEREDQMHVLHIYYLVFFF